MPNIRKYRRDSSEVSCCLKYVIFGVNIVFWIIGLQVIAIGVWAWSEKDTFNNISKLTNIIIFDPVFVVICLGAITFVLGFTGCVGALRENTCLLACYAVFLSLLLIAEMTVGVLGFVFKDWIKQQVSTGLQGFITYYREDPDQQNLIDWIQEGWLQCCGIEGPRDWDRNAYFNCSSEGVGSREACGVPFSCCRLWPNEFTRDKQCGYDVRKPEHSYDIAKTIYEKGCIEAGEEWLGSNLLLVATIAVCVAFAQILGICFAQNLRADIFAQKAKWH